MPNAIIPTARTTMPLCRGPHRSHHHHQTLELLLPSPRDTLLLKRMPKLWVTDHHSTDQPPTTTEDVIHAMERLAPGDGGGGDGDRLLLHTLLTKGDQIQPPRAA
jgi:hypothetical protein